MRLSPAIRSDAVFFIASERAALNSFLIVSLRLPYEPARILGNDKIMKLHGELTIDPGRMPGDRASAEMEIVVPFTEWSLTGALLQRAAELTAGLDAHVTLVAVHTIPYPATFGCPATVHAYLVDQLIGLAGLCRLPVTPQVVLARDREEGFLFVLQPEATVLVGSYKRPWRTSEERLARTLAGNGHKVVLVHIP